MSRVNKKTKCALAVVAFLAMAVPVGFWYAGEKPAPATEVTVTWPAPEPTDPNIGVVPGPGLPPELRPVIKLGIKPAQAELLVLKIYAMYLDPETGELGKVQGTGWAISKRLIVTANHVVANAQDVGEVTFFVGGMGEELRATVLMRGNDESDVAILQAEKDLPFEKFFEMRDKKPEIGEQVWVIGFGAGATRPTMVHGIVCSSYDNIWKLRPRITTDIQAQFGHSGSPVLDKKGRVIGVLTNGYQRGGLLTLIVPVAEVKKLLK